MTTTREKLIELAMELDYDDLDAGHAVASFRIQLQMIADYANKLEQIGFVFTIDCQPVALGGANITLTKDGMNFPLYQQFFDTFGYKYFPRRDLENVTILSHRIAGLEKWAARQDRHAWRFNNDYCIGSETFERHHCHALLERLPDPPRKKGDPIHTRWQCWKCGEIMDEYILPF